MSTARSLYGTDAPQTPGTRLAVGPLSFTLEEGGLRHIRLGREEIIRGIGFLVRDRDWGTLVPELTVIRREVTEAAIALHMRAAYRAGDARLAVDLTLDAAPDGLSFVAEGAVTGRFETNRSGFVVLHPAALAGCPVTIRHGDGRSEATAFPTLIDPWQPFMDIAEMTHRAGGLAVRCVFEGDIFETEDQRQWGDASFKTYSRPLARPWPYVLDAADGLRQSVSLTWRQDARPPARAKPPEAVAAGVQFAQTAIAITAADAARLAEAPEDLADVAPQRLLCHVDTSRGDVAGQCAAFGRMQARLPEMGCDLELVCGFAGSPMEELQAVRVAMAAGDFAPQSVLVCPAVDRQSTPPGSAWPDCPPLPEIHAASAAVFPDLVRGGGMVSFFPELNRKPPPMDLVDFATHGLCPIVHAADDLSVMETLEAIPHITRSARAIIGAKEYRIGPATIAMRHNPYGRRTIANPAGARVCMADADPRHHAAFGAAFAVGLACALAPAGIAVWTPSELYGPRGLSGPLRAAVAALARLAGQPVHAAERGEGHAALHVGGARVAVNLTRQRRAGLEPFAWSVEAGA